MITFKHFKELYQALNGEPEFEIHFHGIENTYMIIKYNDHLSFQRCGYEDGSGEIDFSSLDELYHSESIDGICLKDQWNNIEALFANSAFNLLSPIDIEDMKEIYRIDR